MPKGHWKVEWMLLLPRSQRPQLLKLARPPSRRPRVKKSLSLRRSRTLRKTLMKTQMRYNGSM